MDCDLTDARDTSRSRKYLRAVGVLCVLVALSLGAVIAYETWGTGLANAREQDRLADEFDAQLDEAATGTPATDTAAATAPTTATPTTTATTVTPGTSASTAVTTTTAATDSTPTTTAPVAPATTVDVLPRTVAQDLPPIVRGTAIAQLRIPAIDQDVYIVPGVDYADLELGPGHYPGTPLPGQLGNAAIAGHRTGYGAPFFDVDLLEAGDDIIVTLGNGQRYVYQVTGTEIVSPSDTWVIRTTSPFRATLTLTSCEPKWTTKERIIVHADLDEERSDPLGVATLYEIDADGAIRMSSSADAVVPEAHFDPE